MDTIGNAKKIRKMLKERFPKTKFSVRSEKYSGGSSINVFWIDGPHVGEVEEITDPMELVHRDGYGEILSGGNHFVFCRRAYSEAVYKIAVEKMRDWADWSHVDFSTVKYRLNSDGTCELSENIFHANYGYCVYLDNEVHRLHLAETSFYPESTENSEDKDNDLFEINLEEILAERQRLANLPIDEVALKRQQVLARKNQG